MTTVDSNSSPSILEVSTSGNPSETIDASSSIRKPLSLLPRVYNSPNALWEARTSIFEKLFDTPIDATPQMELLTKTPSQSRTSILYNFSTDNTLKEQYRDPLDKVRIGKLLEDLDALAGTVSYKHCSDHDNVTNHILLVTASVDKITLKKPISVDNDLKTVGAVTWVGRSSIAIQVNVIILLARQDGKSNTLADNVALTVNFTFVARDSKTGDSILVNRLSPETEQEKKLYEIMDDIHKLRKKKRGESGKEVDKGDETDMLNALLANGKICQGNGSNNKDSIFIRDTRLENSLACQLQQRNIHGRILGGVLMHRAFELGYWTAYAFAGLTPSFLEIDHVDFMRPVDVGDFLQLKSCVLYTKLENPEQPLINVEVVSHVTKPELRTSEISNMFYFKFTVHPEAATKNGLKLRSVVPATEEEARQVLERIKAEKPIDEFDLEKHLQQFLATHRIREEVHEVSEHPTGQAVPVPVVAPEEVHLIPDDPASPADPAPVIAPEEVHVIPDHPADLEVPIPGIASDLWDVVIHPVQDPEEPPSSHYKEYTGVPVTTEDVVYIVPYQRVSGDGLLDCHLSQRIAGHDDERSKGRGSLHVIGEWWKLIKNNPLFQHIRERIECTPFMPLIDCKYPHADRQLHRALGERWWPTTQTFHFPAGEIGITPLDFVVITGMSFGEGRRPVIQDEHPITEAQIQLYLPHLGVNSRDRQMINASAVRAYYHRMVSYTGYKDGVEEALDLRPGSAESKEYTLAFLLLLLGIGLFISQRLVISRHWIMPLVDLHLMHQLDWGQAIYTTFIDRLDAFSTTTSRYTSLGGYYPLLEIWYHEYACTLHHRLPDPSVFPRINAWYSHVGDESIIKSHMTLAEARNQIETRFPETINWRPWICLPALARRSLQTALLRSRSRFLMIGYDGVGRMYLGDRHWRQLTGTVSIPHDPPRALQISITARREWQLHNQLPQDGSRFVIPVSSSFYEKWWPQVSRGSLVPAGVYRDGTRDFIGRRSMSKEIFPLEPPVLLPEYTVFTTNGVSEDRTVGAWIEQTPLHELDYQFWDYSLDEIRERYELSLRRLHGIRGGAYEATEQMQFYFSNRITELEAERDAIRAERDQIASQLKQIQGLSGTNGGSIGGPSSSRVVPSVREGRRGNGGKGDKGKRLGGDLEGTSTRNVRARVEDDDI